MVERMNSDLANTLGNLVNRTVSMTNKYFGGSVTDKGVAGDVDADLKAVVDGTPAAVEEKMDKLRVADAITEIFNLFKRCNKYIDETMPWVLAKDEAQKDRLETVLYNLIDSISKGAELLSSFMPETSEKILAQLNGGNVTDKPEILFQRLDLEEVMKKVEELHPPVEEEKEEEGIDKIEKITLLAGENRKSGKTDCVRYQRTLYSRRNGWQKSYGTCEFEACKTCRGSVRRYAFVCRRCRR